MTTTIITIIAALCTYWTIGLVIYLLIERDNDGDSFLTGWAFGIIGISAILASSLMRKHKAKQTAVNTNVILYDIRTNKEVYCNGLEYKEDFQWYTDVRNKRQRYHCVNPNATENDIKFIPRVSTEMIKDAQINCNHCKHKKECDKLQSHDDNDPLCTIDPMTDLVGVFDKFEHK